MKSFANIISVLCFALIFSAIPVFGKSNPEKPNLILIVADDLGYADLGFHGSKQIPTPNIDRLAKEGIIFSNGYVSSSVCSPSRAGLLTGKNQVSFGFDDNLFPAQPGFDPNYVGLPLTEKTLADRLRSLGYVNGLIGKWHLGEKPHFYPLKRGFDEFWGFLGGAHDYFTAKPDEEGMKSQIECTYKNPQSITYITDDIGNESVDFISDNGGPMNSISNGSVNAPLRGQKTTLLEGGIRVPFILKWPARLAAGRKIDVPVSSLDICPSFVEAAGGTTSEKDKLTGVNILPFLNGQTDKTPHDILFWSYTVGFAVRDGDWKLIRLPDRLPMLYHLSEDISEQNDVALQNLERTKAMLKKIGTWEVHLPHPVFFEPADWRIRHLGFYDAEYQLVQPE